MNTTTNQSKKILLIEDERILGDIMMHKLSLEGYNVTLATDGAGGLAKATEWMPDLVLLDLVMPKMSGQEVLEKMRSSDTLKHIPIVIISNSGQHSELERVAELGVMDYVIKAQFSPDELIDKVRKYLNQDDRKQQRIPENTVGASNNVKIMLVEDDQFISSLVVQQLVKEGFSVCTATTGQQALRLFPECKPDLVMLDITMPDMNGLEVLKVIRSDEQNRDVLVGIFSNNGQDHEREEAMNLGADFFYVKVNFTLKEVVQKLCELLSAKGKL